MNIMNMMRIGFKVNIKKAVEFLGLSRLKSPEESIEGIVRGRLMKYGFKC
jgi:hypothetical protein